MKGTPPPPEDPADNDDAGWMTTDEAAAYLRCSDRHLRRAYLEGDLQVARLGSRVLFRKQWLDSHVEQKRPRVTVRRRSA